MGRIWADRYGLLCVAGVPVAARHCWAGRVVTERVGRALERGLAPDSGAAQARARRCGRAQTARARVWSGSGPGQARASTVLGQASQLTNGRPRLKARLKWTAEIKPRLKLNGSDPGRVQHSNRPVKPHSNGFWIQIGRLRLIRARSDGPELNGFNSNGHVFDLKPLNQSGRRAGDTVCLLRQ